ncbi:MAG: hypothetical protein PHQ12_08100 [Chthoniobacteraceae bacterium]|nr:hypothetical protein [Chthoniobacteraceae bacterium]
MNITLFASEKEGNAYLTDETPDNHLAFRSKGDPQIPDGDYKPSDILAPLDPPLRAANLVYSWATDRGRNKQDIACAREYLSQWPDGPQADPDSLKQQRKHDRWLKRAEAKLGTGRPYLNEISKPELRTKLREMEEKLAACASGSPMADVLETRIDLAKVFLHFD